MRPRGEDGASAVEHGILLFAIAAVIVVVLFSLGETVTGLFRGTCDSVSAKADPTATC